MSDSLAFTQAVTGRSELFKWPLLDGHMIMHANPIRGADVAAVGRSNWNQNGSICLSLQQGFSLVGNASPGAVGPGSCRAGSAMLNLLRLPQPPVSACANSRVIPASGVAMLAAPICSSQLWGAVPA
ncbi:hypothetical protein ABID21_002213 [Pseudorhizobium tarimense]|uniref:Uncharacterized protein n=1 Tax=Pseudorhizobium tarimense TaxID=1079109 RepID=A0ABV2H6D8_9HYPH